MNFSKSPENLARRSYHFVVSLRPQSSPDSLRVPSYSLLRMRDCLMTEESSLIGKVEKVSPDLDMIMIFI